MTADLFDGAPLQTEHDNAPVDYVQYAASKFRKEDGELDVVALARGKYEADLFINKMQSEQNELRKELETRLALEAYLEKTIVQKPANKSDPSNIDPQGREEQSQETAVKPFDENRLAELIKSTLKQESTKATQEQNVIHAKKMLQGAWGKDYANKLAEKADELGVGKEFLSRLASESPKAFLSLVGVESSKPVDTGYAPPSTQSRQPMGAPPVGIKNKAYYDKLKKADPKAYWSAKTQAEMHKDAIRLGEAFFN